MQDSLIRSINDIRANVSLLTCDEASIKSGVVMRLLADLKWNPYDVNEIKPEYTIESRRVDFSLRVNDKNKAFIEVKRPSESLEPHQEQLLDYSFRQGVRLAVLTNGLTWWFYLPLIEGGWEERRFYTADLLQQDTSSIAERLIEFLSKPRIMSGEAIDDAQRLHEDHQKKNILKDAIPKAWQKLITTPDDLLIEILVDTTEKLSGFRPDVDDVAKFLKGVVDPQPAPAVKSQITKPPRQITNGTEDYINKTCRNFTLLGTEYHPRSWKELLVTVAQEMYRRHATEFDRCLSLRGSRMVYFSTQGNELKQPVRISDSHYFVETKLNATSIVRRSRDLMSLFGHTEADLSVTAD